MRLKRTYSSREVAALTGLSARQLQIWDAGGLMTPAIAPHRTAAGGYTERRYTPIELFELRVLADLRHRGFSVQQLHTLIAALETHFGVSLYGATGGGERVQLLTDGERMYARTPEGGLYNLLEAPDQPLLVVGNEGVLKDLSASLRPRKRAKKPKSGRSASGSGKPSRGRRRGAG